MALLGGGHSVDYNFLNPIEDVVDPDDIFLNIKGQVEGSDGGLDEQGTQLPRSLSELGHHPVLPSSQAEGILDEFVGTGPIGD